MKKLYRFSRLAFLALCAFACTHAFTGGKSEHYIKAQVMKIYSGAGMCSGEQIIAPSGKTYILTAAHCRSLSDASGSFTVKTEDGRILQRKLIAEDPFSDLLLLEGDVILPGLHIGGDLSESQHLRTYTHGKRHETYRTDGEAIEIEQSQVMIKQLENPEEHCSEMPKIKEREIPSVFGTFRICLLDTLQTSTTAKVVPGSSGGPVVDDRGNLVGVVSATDGDFGFLVTPKDIKAFLSNY